MRVAVAGAGFQGACIALELSSRGCSVDLFDRMPVPVSRAGFGNEGKIHLGLVYAKDKTHRSISVMLRGALHFADCLDRWIDFRNLDAGFSQPFYYVVHRQSQLSVSEISSHFERVQSAYSSMREDTGRRYLYRDNHRIFSNVSDTPEADQFDLSLISGVFATAECAVDPERIAVELRGRIADDEAVNFMGETSVNAVSTPERGNPKLKFTRDGVFESGCYDHIVNALWAGKLALDQTVYGLPDRPWIFRNKLGLMVQTTEPVASLSSMTMVIGPYGDIVNYGNGLYYLSWYPDCMVGLTRDAVIGDWETGLDEQDKTRIMDQTISALADFCPGAGALADVDARRLKGGPIFAWGESDIEDVHSELHNRYDVGIHSRGRYHSVNTGKYTLAPLYAVELADRILGKPRRSRQMPV